MYPTCLYFMNILCLFAFPCNATIPNWPNEEVWCLYILQNASLQTESSLLKEQLKQLENQNTSLNNQMVALQRHATTLQEQNSGLHSQTAKLQVCDMKLGLWMAVTSWEAYSCRLSSF